VPHRRAGRSHDAEEIREPQVAGVDGLLFPHARRVVRIRRRSRPLGTRKWTGENVYAVTVLPAEQATPAETAAWDRDHRKTADSAHLTRDVTSGEDARTIRTRNALASQHLWATPYAAPSEQPAGPTPPAPDAPTPTPSTSSAARGGGTHAEQRRKSTLSSASCQAGPGAAATRRTSPPGVRRPSVRQQYSRNTPFTSRSPSCMSRSPYGRLVGAPLRSTLTVRGGRPDPVVHPCWEVLTSMAP
jgi:hypothetical protein